MLTSTPSGFAFAANPITYTGDPHNAATSYRITLGGRSYEGRFTAPLCVNASEVAQSFSGYLPASVPEMQRIGPVVCIDNDLSARRLTIYEDDEPVFSATVIPGGVSKQNFRTYSHAGTDAFAARYLNHSGCFFLTARAADWRITVPEAELAPLYFINHVGQMSLRMTDPISGHSITSGLTTPGIYALDIEALRRQMYDQHGAISSVFDVSVSLMGAQYIQSCRITVTESPISAEHYRIRWRTSLGVYDIIVLSGHASISPYSDDGEDSGPYLVYDELVDSHVKQRDRLTVSPTITIETSEVDPAAVGLLLDMISSDDVCIITDDGLEIPVVPSAKDAAIDLQPTAPVSMAIQLTLAEDDNAVLPVLLHADQSQRRRLHTEEFNDKFN